MTGGTVAYFQPNFIDIVLARFQHFAGVFHFIIEQEPEHRVPVNLLEALLQLFKAQPNLLR